MLPRISPPDGPLGMVRGSGHGGCNLAGGGHQSDGENQDVFGVRQGDAVYYLVLVEIKRVSIDVKRSVVLGAIANRTIWYDHSFGFALVAVRRIPIAQALRDRRRCTVGIGDGKDLCLLAAFNTSSEKIEAREFSLWQRDGFSSPHLRGVGWSEMKRNAVPQLRGAQGFRRIGKPAAVEARRGSEF